MPGLQGSSRLIMNLIAPVTELRPVRIALLAAAG